MDKEFYKTRKAREKAFTRRQLVSAAAKRANLPVKDTENVLELMLTEIAKALTGEDSSVLLSGFGRFETAFKSGRQGRNPATGAPAAITPRIVMKFFASDTLRAMLNQNLSLTAG